MGEQELLARLAVGFGPQIRYYRMLELLGMSWAAPTKDHLQRLHDKNMMAITEFMNKEKVNG